MSEEAHRGSVMIVFAILVALATLSWLGSLAYAYFTNPIERSGLNKRPAVIMIALLAAVSLVVLLIGINSPYGNLSILIGEQQFRIWVFGLIGCIIFTALGFSMRRR
jgi:hypothetical protein